jgi:hypothetical protein
MNYSASKIYKIVNSIDSLVYIGSTTQTLAKRFYKHKIDSKTVINKFYQHVNNIGGWDLCKILLIENFKCASKEELRAREFYHQQQLDTIKNGLNTNAAMFNLQHSERGIRDSGLTQNEKREKINKMRSYNRNKTGTIQRLKMYLERNKDKYICEICGFRSAVKTHYNIHNRTKRHNLKFQNQLREFIFS